MQCFWLFLVEPIWNAGHLDAFRRAFKANTHPDRVEVFEGIRSLWDLLHVVPVLNLTVDSAFRNSIFWSPFAFTSFSFIYQFICLLLLLLSLYLLLIVLIGRTEAPGIVWLSPPVLLELCVLCTEHNLFIWTEKIDYSFWWLKFPGWESRKKEQRTRDNKSAGFRCFTTGQNCARFTRFNDCVHAVSRSIVLISLGHGFCFFLIYFTFPRMSERKI